MNRQDKENTSTSFSQHESVGNPRPVAAVSTPIRGVVSIRSSGMTIDRFSSHSRLDFLAGFRFNDLSISDDHVEHPVGACDELNERYRKSLSPNITSFSE
jgi:hypothetical protein